MDDNTVVVNWNNLLEHYHFVETLSYKNPVVSV